MEKIEETMAEDISITGGRISDIGGVDGRPSISLTPGRVSIQLPEEVMLETPEKRGVKRPRPVRQDRSTQLASSVIKDQLADPSGLIRDLDPAPASKKAMLRKERELKGPEAYFNLPNVDGLSDCPELMELFQRNLVKDVTPEDRMAESRRLDTTRDTTDLGSPITHFEDTTFDGLGRDEEPPLEGEEIPSEERVEEAGITYEETELLAWTERSVRMVHFLDKNFTSAEKEGERELSLQELVKGKSKRVVAGTFFEFLVLKTKNLIDMKQEEPYGEIKILKTANFNRAPRRDTSVVAAEVTVET